MNPRSTILPLAALVALACAAAAWAGQVRVNVTAGFAFSPSAASANVDDHIVWIWIGGGHTVTSGDQNTEPDYMAGDGHFNSSPTGAGLLAGSAFSWKVDFTGTEPYYCQPHSGMVGSLTLTASGTTGLSDFRITEVQFNAAGNLDQIEIANLGGDGDLGKYRLKVGGFAVQTLQIGASTNIAVAGGGRVVLHCNTTGTNTTSNLFLPAITDLPANGSVALYVPNTVNTALTLANQMIDFVQWGAGGQENESTAQTAGLWNTGAAITNVAANHSIEFCGQPGEYGATQWHEISTPNFGSDGNCATPAFSTTWGRLKTLYR